MFQKNIKDKRPRRRAIRNVTMGMVVIFILSYIVVLFVPHEEKYEQYLEVHQSSLEFYASPDLDKNLKEINGKIAVLEQELSQTKDDTQVEKIKNNIERLTTSKQKVSATFPMIPFGYRKTGFKALEKPSGKHWLGVDQSTRDVAVRMLYGTRIALSIGVIAVSIYVTIGVIIGSMAGFFGGIIDLMVVRFIEIFMSIPGLFVILTILAFVDKPSIFHIMGVIGLLSWTGVARLVRGEFLRLRNLDFVNAAIALGFPTRRIIFQHVLPNALGPVLVNATFGVASAILTESTLSFLGLGDASVPSWGQTLSEGYATSAWHLILTPGIAIFITVSLLNQLGDGVRSALDPKARK